jgi:phage terminase small subunit
MVNLEINIRRYNQELNENGVVIENKRGTPVENPLLRVVDTLQRQQLAMIRSLSLGVSSQAAQDLNKSGTSASEKEDVEKLKKGKVSSLLAI